MSEIQTQHLHWACLLGDPLAAQLYGPASRGLDVLVDSRFAEKEVKTLEQVTDSLVAQAEDVEQDTQAFQGVRLVSAGNARRIDAESALALQTATAPSRDLGIARIPQRLGAIRLMFFEASAATFLLRMLEIWQRAVSWSLENLWLDLGQTNTQVHRILRDRRCLILTHFTNQ